MRPIGFSTGALAKGDVRLGLEIQRPHARLTATELSALRDWELRPLAESIAVLDTSQFTYVSIHAPSKLSSLSEGEVFELLVAMPEESPLIVHPEIATTPAMWRTLGRRLCLENMDNRKSGGRTVDELRELFDKFPQAGFCLDIGHARQIDPTMASAIQMLNEFRDRLVQIHVSEVGSNGEHLPVSAPALFSFQVLSDFIPATCPLIIESVVEPADVAGEVEKCEAIFGAAPRRKRLSLIDLAAAMTNAG